MPLWDKAHSMFSEHMPTQTWTEATGNKWFYTALNRNTSQILSHSGPLLGGIVSKFLIFLSALSRSLIFSPGFPLCQNVTNCLVRMSFLKWRLGTKNWKWDWANICGNVIVRYSLSACGSDRSWSFHIYKSHRKLRCYRVSWGLKLPPLHLEKCHHSF